MHKIWGMIALGIVAAGGTVFHHAAGSGAHAPQTGATVNGNSASRVAATLQSAQDEIPKPARVLDEDQARAFADDFILGQKNAPVTIIEYASLTCPHCAQFHNDVLPKLKKEFVETGKVRLIYRDFPLDRYALNASMLARCAGPDRYFAFLDVLFKSQSNWTRAEDPGEALSRLARLGGMQPNEIDACLQDKALQDEVLNQRLDASQRLQVRATPTLIINGSVYSGGLPFDRLKAVIESMLTKT